MPSTSTKKSALQYIGLALFAIALLIFTAMLGLDNYTFQEEGLTAPFAAADDAEPWKKESSILQQEALKLAAGETGVLETEYATTFAAEKDLKRTFYTAKKYVAEYYDKNGLPVLTDESGNAKTNEDGSAQTRQLWEVELPEWQFKSQLPGWIKGGANGPVTNNPLLFFFLTIGLAALGGLLYIIPKFGGHAGIKNDHIYHSQLTKGLDLGWRGFFLAATILGILVYGFYYMDDKWVWPVATGLIGLLIIVLVLFAHSSFGRDVRNAEPEGLSAYLGILAGVYFMGFYVLLYWASQHVVAWVTMVSPISEGLYQTLSGRDTGGEASQWFLYGLMYTLIMLVMGVRMIAKYRHNKYQVVRTVSVVFFQLAFAFLIPEIMLALNKGWHGDQASLPYQDLKNIWPLDYDFFHSWSVNGFLDNPGSLGTFMLFWGIALVVIGVPLMVYFLGKRWYCSWVCGCGGLAETMGDPWRQLSDKSLRAWKFERYIIHGVLLFAIVMTAATIYSYLPQRDYLLNRQSFLAVFSILIGLAVAFAVYSYAKNRFEISRLGLGLGIGAGALLILFNGYTMVAGSETYLFSSAGAVQKWYGFLIGAGFAGVVGTGFYPLMGNRVWCRFGCPLAAYLGLVQRFQSKFRITTNGGQCISCGNCSTYCEMGIDVRHYAQKGQDIVRSSCVGCGVCSAVCPRGVLRLENGSEDINQRAVAERVIHISEEGVSLME